MLLINLHMFSATMRVSRYCAPTNDSTKLENRSFVAYKYVGWVNGELWHVRAIGWKFLVTLLTPQRAYYTLHRRILVSRLCIYSRPTYHM